MSRKYLHSIIQVSEVHLFTYAVFVAHSISLSLVWYMAKKAAEFSQLQFFYTGPWTKLAPDV